MWLVKRFAVAEEPANPFAAAEAVQPEPANPFGADADTAPSDNPFAEPPSDNPFATDVCAKSQMIMLVNFKCHIPLSTGHFVEHNLIIILPCFGLCASVVHLKNRPSLLTHSLALVVFL